MNKKEALISSIIVAIVEALIFMLWVHNDRKGGGGVPGLDILYAFILLILILAHGLIYLVLKLLFRRSDVSFFKYLFLVNFFLWLALFVLNKLLDDAIFSP